DHLALGLTEYVLDEALDEVNDLGDESLRRMVEVLRLVLSGMADDEERWASGDEGSEDRFRDKNERYVSRDEFVEAVNDALKKSRTLVAQDYDSLIERLTEALVNYTKRYNDESRGLGDLHEFLRNWTNERRGLARILTKEPTPALHYKMLDPSILAKPVFDSIHASVVMSGTLH